MKQLTRILSVMIIVLFAWLLSRMHLRDVFQHVMSAHIGWFLAAILLQAAVLPIWATLWRCFLPNVGFRQLYESAALSGAAMIVTPSITGQAGAIAILMRRCRLSLAEAASAMGGEQVCEAMAKGVVLFAALMFAPLSPELRNAARIGGAAFALVAIAAVVIRRVWRKPFWSGVVVALVIKGVEMLGLVAVQQSLGVVLGIGPLLLILAVAAIGIIAASVLPVIGPVGVGEAVVAFGYTQLGLSAELAVALVAVHTASLIIARVGAAGLVLARK
jgi:hypothetical protein